MAEEKTSVSLYVGSRLKLRRLELNLTQSDIAEQVGVTYQQIQKYESGRDQIGAERMFTLAKAMNVEVEYFFSGFKSAKSQQSDPPFELDRATRSIIRDLNKLPIKTKHSLADLLREMVSALEEKNDS